jgi:formylglycine-generating enzyme required for sulfatase activity
MVMVPADAGSSYCVDATEVTIAQYAAFLATSPDTAAQPSFCKPWNSNHSPKLVGACQTVNFNPGMVPDNPMVCINWCDADAYCKWAGKRLCGAVTGGPNDYGAASNPAMSQWYRACSAAGANSFPYGDVFEAEACVGDAYDGQAGYDMLSDQRQKVGTALDCEGGYKGLFDLSGNVQEWEDACEGYQDQNDTCLARGGSYEEGPPLLFCNVQNMRPRFDARNELGFRCCADLP